MEPVFDFDQSNLDIPIGKPTTVAFTITTFEPGDFKVTLELPKAPPIVFIKDGKPFKSITEYFSLEDGEDEFTELNRSIDVVVHPYDDGDYAQLITGFATNSTDSESLKRKLVVRIFHEDGTDNNAA